MQHSALNMPTSANVTNFAAVDQMRYRAFGESRDGGTNLNTDHKFTSQIEDAIIGLYCYRARAYDPAIGRFVQPDTIVPNGSDPQALNRYAYGRNNPIRYADPSGHDWEDEGDRGNGGDWGGEDIAWQEPSFEAAGAIQSSMGSDTVSADIDMAIEPDIRPQGTVSFSPVGFAAFAAVGVEVSPLTLAFDLQGNVAALSSAGTGGYSSVGINSGWQLGVTNARSVDDLTGASVQLGGYVGQVAAVGVETVAFSVQDADGSSHTFGGLNVGSGPALQLPLPFEVHTTVDFTHMHGMINVHDAIRHSLWGVR